MRRYRIGGPLEEDPIYFYVITEDDDIILQTYLPSYRQADAITKNVLLAWEEYAAATGSPMPQQTIAQLIDYLDVAYPSTYKARRST